MYCHQCGNQISEGAVFCTNCGTQARTLEEILAKGPVEKEKKNSVSREERGDNGNTDLPGTDEVTAEVSVVIAEADEKNVQESLKVEDIDQETLKEAPAISADDLSAETLSDVIGDDGATPNKVSEEDVLDGAVVPSEEAADAIFSEVESTLPDPDIESRINSDQKKEERVTGSYHTQDSKKSQTENKKKSVRTQDPRDVPMTLSGWIVTMLIMMVPLVNIVMMFVWAIDSSTNRSKQTYFQAVLIMGLVAGVLFFVFLIGLGIFFTVAGSQMYY